MTREKQALEILDALRYWTTLLVKSIADGETNSILELRAKTVGKYLDIATIFLRNEPEGEGPDIKLPLVSIGQGTSRVEITEEDVRP